MKRIWRSLATVLFVLSLCGQSILAAGLALQADLLPDDALSRLTDVCFLNCPNLRSITVGEGTTSIEKTIAIGTCPVLSLRIPASVGSITTDPLSVDTAPSAVTIYGYTGSAAETCARDYGYAFVSTGSMAVPGDINGNGTVNTTDARLALQYAVDKITLEEMQCIVGDVDGDGIVNTTDARLILQRAVEKIDRFPIES